MRTPPAIWMSFFLILPLLLPRAFVSFLRPTPLVPCSTLKKASHRLYLWPGLEGDGNLETSTPSKVANDPNRKRDEMARLEKVGTGRDLIGGMSALDINHPTLHRDPL